MTPPRPLVALLPAAGSGVRMGGARPKALLELRGRPIVRLTAETFARTPFFERIIVLAPADHTAEFGALLADLPGVVVIAGGAERQASVQRGLHYIETELPDVAAHGSVLIHDAARCLVSEEIIARCVAAHAHFPAVTAAIPVVDTLVRSDGAGQAAGSVDRTDIYAVQTPQLFSCALLVEAHRRSSGGATDDASLVAPLAAVHLVEGDRANIKITTPGDIAFGEALLKSGVIKKA